MPWTGETQTLVEVKAYVLFLVAELYCHHILQHLENNVLDMLYYSPNLSSLS